MHERNPPEIPDSSRTSNPRAILVALLIRNLYID